MVMPMKERHRRILIESIVTLLLCTGVFLLVLLLRKKFDIVGVCDAFFVASAPALLLPLFVYIARAGTFDVLRYSFYRLVESFRPGEGKRYDTAYDYKLAKQERREKKPVIYWPFFAVGGLFLLVAIILFIVYKCNS